jgi:hypothetical protein
VVPLAGKLTPQDFAALLIGRRLDEHSRTGVRGHGESAVGFVGVVR